MCAMFGFHLRIVHVSKDDAYDANNNVIISNYQVPIIVDLGLEWRVNFRRFNIVVENLSKSFQNIVLTPNIAASVVNVVSHLVEIKQEVFANHVNPQSLLIDLCDSFDEDGTPIISFYTSESSL
jgi:hypothetical protein